MNPVPALVAATVASVLERQMSKQTTATILGV
jgi:hypothetical protein